MTTERNPSTHSKINHSGNIPDESMRETPLNSYDKSLRDAASQKLIGTHIPQSGEGFIDPIPHENGIRRFLRTGLGKASVIGASLLTAGGIVGGITESMHHNETPVQAAAPSHLPKASHSEKASPVASATPSPSDLPTQPTAESTPLVLPQPLSPAEQQIDALSEDAYNNLPIEQRVGYIGALIGGDQGLQEYAKEYYSISQNPEDELPTTISLSNTPQEIATVAGYAERLSLSFTGETEKKVLDGTLYHGPLSDEYPPLKSVVEADPAGETPKDLAYNNYLPINTSNLTMSEVAPAAGSNIPYVTISGEAGGTPFSARFYYVSTSYDGQPFNLWVRE